MKRLIIAALLLGELSVSAKVKRGSVSEVARTAQNQAVALPGYLVGLAADYELAPVPCTAAPYTFPAIKGNLTVPESATNQTHTCNQTTDSDSGFELIGSAAGLLPNGIGQQLVGRGIATLGTSNWINTTAGAIPQTDNQQQAICVLYRPRAATGYLFQWNSTATEYIRLRVAANSFIAEMRGDGSGNLTQSNTTNIGVTSQIHFSCWRLFDVCEVQSAGRGCQSVCTDGQCLDGTEFATDVNSFAQSVNVTIGSDSVEGTRFTGDIFWIGYWRTTAATESTFGTTRASFLAANRTIISNLGIGTTKNLKVVIGAGQSAMVGFNATPVLTSANQAPHRESLGTTNTMPLLHEGTGTGASESRGSALCNEWTAFDPTVQCVWIERGVSNTSISTWNDGNVSANFDTLQTWWTNALRLGCGKWASATVYVVWHQGENDMPDLATWHSDLAAIQDSFDTLVRAEMCVNNVEVKMLIQQESDWQDAPFSNATSDLVVLRQYAAGVTDYVGRMYLAGPEFFIAFQTDSHPTNVGQQQLGRQNARALYRIDQGLTQASLTVNMTAANVVGSVVTVDFNTPRPPLSITCGDTNAGSFGVTDPGNRGFEWSDASARTISSFGTITCDSGTGPTTCHVPITLSAAPGASRVLSIARTGIVNNDSGPTTGPRNCIHDADVTAAGVHEPNWAVHQTLSVP